MTTPDALREKVAVAITNAHEDDPGLTTKELDAAIRVVVEACAGSALNLSRSDVQLAAGEFTMDEWRAAQAALAVAANRIKDLMPKETT